MSSDIQRKPLGDYVTLVSGNTPSKAKDAYWGGTVPWISAKDMGEFWISDSIDHITDEGLKVASRLVEAGSTLILTRGMTLHKRVPICRVFQPATFNQDVKAVLPKAGVSSRFLPYLLLGNHDALHQKVDSAGHGTGRLNTEALLSFPVWMPKAGMQDAIASIGEAIDCRITLLRETNKTLESIAQTIFKSWFVDFDPVRAKMKGRQPEGMDEATAALFPDSFEESELGLIPKGWRVGQLSELLKLYKGSVNPGATPSTEYLHYSLPAYDADMMAKKELGSAIKSNKTIVPQNAVLFSKLNPVIPRIWLPVEFGSHAICSTEFLPFVPTNESNTPYIYCLLKSSGLRDQIVPLASGTSNSHQRIRPDSILSLANVLPNARVIEKFETVVESMLARAKANQLSIQLLRALRDTLLPRLISGKLRLPDVHQQVETAIP